MTVLVDTSAWIEYLRGTGSPHNRWIRGANRAETPLGWTEPVLYELTAGAGSPRRVEGLRALLRRGPMVAVEALQVWEDGMPRSCTGRHARRDSPFVPAPTA